MAAKPNPLRRVLSVSLVQDRARYTEVIVYSEEDFKRIIESWAEISEKFKKEFRSKVEGYGVKIEDLKVNRIPREQLNSDNLHRDGMYMEHRRWILRRHVMADKAALPRLHRRPLPRNNPLTGMDRKNKQH